MTRLDSPVAARAAVSSSPPHGTGTDGIVTTVLLPAYNEAEALPQVLRDLHTVLDEHSEILIVDDGSTDGTAEAAQGPRCRLIRHPANQGKGAAVRTGLAAARGRNVIVMDADATYPATAVPRIAALLADHDVVRCRRLGCDKHMGFINRAGNALFDLALRLTHGLEGTDHLSGLYGLRRDTAVNMFLEADGFDIEAEIGIKAHVRGLRIATFPIEYQPRLGAKKLRPWQDGFMILGRMTVLLLVYNPMRAFVLPGFILMVLALGGAMALSRGPVITPYFGLSIHSFILATLGSLAAFQLIIFGTAAALYGVEAGYRPPAWLIKLSWRWIRLGGGALGVFLAGAAGFTIVRLVVRWFAGGRGDFTETRTLVLAATVLVWGLQVLSAALFLSIFAGRLQRARQQRQQRLRDAPARRAATSLP